MLAGWLGADKKDIWYTCAGINHQAFYLEFKWKGKDANPLLREIILGKKDIYNEEQVRNEMFLNLGYYPTESSGHNSEYNAWFRKRPDLIEKYCTHGTGWNPGVYAYILDEYTKKGQTWEAEFKKRLAEEEVDLKRGEEYASNIFNAIFGDNTPFQFNGNLPNTNLVDNLPPMACVEVPVLASKAGIKPFHVGPLPDHLAILVNTSSRCEELAIRGAIEGDPEKIYQAILFDPLTASVLSMSEIREMTRAMLDKNRDFLKSFKTLKI
jgi:alpha-galactosidase